MGLSLCPERGHEGCNCKVPREDRCSSIYIVYYAFLSCIYIYVFTSMIHLFDYSVVDYLLLPFLHVGNLICNTIWCLFSPVKNKP